jgi:SAM-dependent methyltransferase
MNIKEEMIVYNAARVSYLTGETESYDSALFPNVIRKRELEIIEYVLRAKLPSFILDYGCGGGWLSTFLRKLGFNSVGVDVSKNMVKNAKVLCPDGCFIVCDAMNLPFKQSVFDFVIGISILHHLDVRRATAELKRISFTRSTFLFMEPNLLNPFSAFGRRFFPTEAHTEGEKPYTPEYLKSLLDSAGFNVEQCFAIFLFTFSVARLLRITRLNTPYLLAKITYFFEYVIEKLPGFRYVNSSIVTIMKYKE